MKFEIPTALVTVLFVIFLGIFGFAALMVGRGIQSSLLERQDEKINRLEKMIFRTEQVINQNGDESTKITFWKMGYNIVLPDSIKIMG